MLDAELLRMRRVLRDDLSDLGDVCARLVRDTGEQERLARGARDYFDRYLHRRQLGAYYLSEICNALDRAR